MSTIPHMLPHSFQKRWQKFSTALPFQLGSLVFLLLTISILMYWRKTAATAALEGGMSMINLLIKVGVTIFFLFITSSIITTFISWWLLLSSLKKKQLHTQLSLKSNGKIGARLQVNISPVRKPLWGSVRAILFFKADESAMTLPLLKQHGILSTNMSNSLDVEAIHIQAYPVSALKIQLVDFLRLLQLPVLIPTQQELIRLPDKLQADPSTASPLQTQMPQQRINEMRKVVGDITNYKDFEPGDDIRRVVWKIYARHKELVVRIPENFEPFANHLNLLVSFYCLPKWIGQEEMAAHFLDEYKQDAWSVSQQLQSTLELKWSSDQAIYPANNLLTKEAMSEVLARSSWQTRTPPLEALPKKGGVILLVSSLCPAGEIIKIHNKYLGKVLVLPLLQSGNLPTHAYWKSLKLLFIKPKSVIQKNLENSWHYSPYRKQIVNNEKQLLAARS